jgi:N-acetyldiaminopimelate deacetylase
MTALVGLIHYVLANRLKMNLLFFFQPAEEGHGGAMHIINTGVFGDYKIGAAYALHVTGAYPTGSIGVKSGIIFGIPQEFDIEFTGKSGHVSIPHKGRDAFLAGMAFYESMKRLMTVRFPAQEPVLFHIGKANAGTVRNIIPEYCKLEGTFRCLSKEIKNDIITLMNTVAKSIEHSHDVDVKVSLLSSYDPVVNDEYLTNKLIENLPNCVSVIDVDYSMTGEDFGFFSGMYPSVLFWLGTNSNEDLHSSRFLPDEKSIDTALEVYKSILESSTCQQ